jgi:hypothetical protein
MWEIFSARFTAASAEVFQYADHDNDMPQMEMKISSDKGGLR